MLFHGLIQIYCLQQEQLAGAVLEAAELRKHTTNDTKCAELGLHPTCGGIIWSMGKGGAALFFLAWHQAIVQHHNSKSPLNFIQD